MMHSAFLMRFGDFESPELEVTRIRGCKIVRNKIVRDEITPGIHDNGFLVTMVWFIIVHGLRLYIIQWARSGKLSEITSMSINTFP